MARFSLSGKGTGNKRQILLCLLCVLVAALVSFWLNLPVQPLADRLVQFAAAQGVAVQIDRPALALPVGLRAAKVAVKVPDLPRPPLPLSSVVITPAWTSLFGNNPGIDVEAGFMAGKLQAEAHRNGELQLQLQGLQLSESLGPQLPLEVVARVESGLFNGRLPLVGKNKTKLELTLRNVALVGMKKLGSAKDRLSLGQVKLRAEGRGPAFKINALTSAGGDIEANGSGNLNVGRTAATSRLSLALQLKPGASLDAGLRDLLSLLGKPGRDGKYRLRLSGPLTAVQMR